MGTRVLSRNLPPRMPAFLHTHTHTQRKDVEQVMLNTYQKTGDQCLGIYHCTASFGKETRIHCDYAGYTETRSFMEGCLPLWRLEDGHHVVSKAIGDEMVS